MYIIFSMWLRKTMDEIWKIPKIQKKIVRWETHRIGETAVFFLLFSQSHPHTEHSNYDRSKIKRCWVFFRKLWCLSAITHWISFSIEYIVLDSVQLPSFPHIGITYIDLYHRRKPTKTVGEHINCTRIILHVTHSKVWLNWVHAHTFTERENKFQKLSTDHCHLPPLWAG